MTTSTDDPSNNRSLLRALNLLSCFQFDKPELGLTELTSMSGLPKATVYRLASTLVYSGFLKYDDQSKRYSLGVKLFELGSIVFASFSLRRVASPYLTQLHVAVNRRTVFLGVLLEDKLVYMDKRENTSTLRFSTDVGRQRPPHFGMLGQVLMAFLSESEVDKLLEGNPLEPMTEKTITDPQLFKERLRLIRRQGYVVEEGEVLDIITGVAAPVRDYTGKVVAAIGVSFISSSVDYQAIKEIVTQTAETAAQISQDLGYPTVPRV